MNQIKPILTITKTTNPHFNIALEEWYLKKYKGAVPVIFLWQNFNSIIIGRNQNTNLEINHKLVRDYKVNVARRLSGGGAVFQDKFNVCWTIILEKKHAGNYEFFTKSICEFLQSIGVDAKFSGRNDITVDGKKISGTSQIVYNDRSLCHGTILFDVDLEMLTSLLMPNLEKLSSKGVDSIRKRVTNIREHLNDMDIETFKTKLILFLEKYFNATFSEIPQEALDYAEERAKNHFSTWEWNYGMSKEFEFKKKKYFDQKGSVEINFNLKNGIIEDIKIYGDFFFQKDISELENLLKKQRYNYEDLNAVLEKINISDYVEKLTHEEFMECLYS